jgi:hypothetical protein
MSQDDLEPLPPDLQLLLRKGRPGVEPPPAAREAVRSFVAAQAGVLGAAALAHGVTHAHAMSAASAASPPTLGGALGRALFALKGTFGIGGLLVGAAVGAAGHALLADHPAVSTPVVVAPHPEASVAAVSAPPLASASAPAPAPVEIDVSRLPQAPFATAAPAAPIAPAAPAASSDTKDAKLASERVLIDMARTAVGRGQGDAALEALQRHAREFPRGQLAEDREWLAIQALLLTGRTDAAKQRAERFRAAFPRSMMLPELDRRIPSE